MINLCNFLTFALDISRTGKLSLKLSTQTSMIPLSHAPLHPKLSSHPYLLGSKSLEQLENREHKLV